MVRSIRQLNRLDGIDMHWTVFSRVLVSCPVHVADTVHMPHWAVLARGGGVLYKLQRWTVRQQCGLDDGELQWQLCCGVTRGHSDVPITFSDTVPNVDDVVVGIGFSISLAVDDTDGI